MKPQSRQFLYGISMLIGMIIGVGLFGVPYAISRAGWLPGIICFLIVSGTLLLVNLFYGEVVLRTRERHRFVGFAEKYLGKKYGKPLGASANILAFYGAILAYIIVGGDFLHIVLSPILGGDVFWYQIVFFFVMSLIVLKGLRLVAGIEVIMGGLVLLIMLLLAGFALRFFDFSNYILLDRTYAFLPYGVILFALGGSAAIPEIRDILKKDGKQMRKIITLGSIVPYVVILFFTFAVVGATGLGTSQEAIQGLQGVLGNWIIILGALFGLLALSTSFLILGVNLKEMFMLDYKMKHFPSWVLAVFVPFLIFLIGSRSFIGVAGVTGSLFGGFLGILTALMYLKAKKLGDRSPEYNLNIPRFFAYMVMVIYTLGIIYEIVYLF